MPRHKPTVSGSCAGHWVTEGACLALFFWEPERQSSGGKINRNEITLREMQILSLSLTSLTAFGQMTAGCLSVKFDNNRRTSGSYWEAERGMECKKNQMRRQSQNHQSLGSIPASKYWAKH